MARDNNGYGIAGNHCLFDRFAWIRCPFTQANRGRKKLDYSLFGQVVVNAVIYAAVIHMFVLWISMVLFGNGVRFDILIRLLSSCATTADHDVITLNVRDMKVVVGSPDGALAGAA